MIPARGLLDVAQQLTTLLADAPDTPPLAPFAAAPAPRRVVAVDGSHVTLAEGGKNVLGAYRWGRVRLERGVALAPEPQPAQVALFTPASARPLTPIQALESRRAIAELHAARESLDWLERGDMLLLDGALQARAAPEILDAILERAKRDGIDVVGVCKSTSLALGAVPALVACQIAGRRVASPRWFAELPAPPAVRGRVLAARLSGAEERVFRFDVAASDADAARVLGSLATLAGHPAYPGYPSPLAMAHNAALLTDETRRALLAQLQEAAQDAGVPESTWTAAFFDYHDVLELGA